uniref:NADH-ubiquinone oxidoreductase chain 4 n=1 Tax=Megophrys sp. FH-2015 TaxID=1747826 RepID=A0A0S1S5X1_9ANUR|nr:NADH dehydrogenase subunit 4 [Megophrys sp. FH-2015]
MLTILIATTLLLPSAWLVPKSWLWSILTAESLLIASFSTKLLQNHTFAPLLNINILWSDDLSSPLLALSCWLLPLMILAGAATKYEEPVIFQRMYINAMIFLQIFLITAFSAYDFTLFYIMFEATIIPTLFIITRWGPQGQRLKAGSQFMFYTLIGSLPLLIALIYLWCTMGTQVFPILNFLPQPSSYPWANKLLGLACLLAFLVKMPLYGVHLWLPKAHVEAPIPGPMVLAAILLKLGGYGMMRISLECGPALKTISYPFVILSLWGLVMTCFICLRQTDMKSFIAYSSVGHMGIVIAGILIETPLGFHGALTVMIAHGFISSLLFYLTNAYYERTHTRTIILIRGLKVFVPLLTLWWLLAILANMAFPPTPNFIGEVVLIQTLYEWASPTFILTGLAMILTAWYSLHFYVAIAHGTVIKNFFLYPPDLTKEQITALLHMLPLLLLALKPLILAMLTSS